MTELYADRKQRQLCTRGCGRRSARDMQICETCAPGQREAQRSAMADLRAWRRAFELCAQCGVWSGEAYRCDDCAARKKERWAGARLAVA